LGNGSGRAALRSGMFKGTCRLAVFCPLLLLPSCITCGLWSTTTQSRIESVQPLEVRCPSNGCWFLRLPPEAAADGEWIAVVPAENQAALGELARVAALSGRAAAAGLSLRIDRPATGDDPWAGLRAPSPDKQLTLSLTLPIEALGDVHWCEGLRIDPRDNDIHLRAWGKCEVTAAAPPPEDLTPFAGSGLITARRADAVSHRFGLGERLLMTPVTVTCDVLAIPLLPFAGAFLTIGSRYIQS
jgi:hypothetical protein